MAIIPNRITNFTSVAVLLFTSAIFFEEHSWIASLFAHFRVWFLVSSLAVFVIAVRSPRKNLWVLVAMLGVFTIHSWAVAPFYFRPKTDLPTLVKQNPELTVFYANVNSQNRHKSYLNGYLNQNRPDLVLLVETNRSWFEALKDLEPVYPFSKAILQESNFGMAILSKFPLSVENLYVDRENLTPALWVGVGLPNRKVHVFLLHPYPPIGRFATLSRDQYLRTLARNLADIEQPVLVCGDFNTTPWSKVFMDFMETAKLQLSERYTTFNTWWATDLLPGLPIDHCASKGLRITSYRPGPDIRSDHRPLSLTVAL